MENLILLNEQSLHLSIYVCPAYLENSSNDFHKTSYIRVLRDAVLIVPGPISQKIRKTEIFEFL